MHLYPYFVHEFSGKSADATLPISNDGRIYLAYIMQYLTTVNIRNNVFALFSKCCQQTTKTRGPEGPEVLT